MPDQEVLLYISNEYFHHHSDGILEKYNEIKRLFVAALEKNATLSFIDRKKGGGISSPSLNKEVRRLLGTINDILFEVNQKDGVFYFSGQTSGFDFAMIDASQNVVNFRNLCFGKRQYLDGERQWNRFLKQNPRYFEIAERLMLPNPEEHNFGEDIIAPKTAPLILGEIQFGNWALAYRDLFKVLQANILTTVDVLIYIVSDGALHNQLSDGIVNFNETKNIIEEFAKVITVPIWVIGLDYK